MNQIATYVTDCRRTPIGGIKRLWLADRRQFGRYWFYGETHNLQYGQVIGNVANGIWTEVPVLTDRTQWAQALAEDANRAYGITLSYYIPVNDTDARDAVEQYTVGRTVMAAAMDRVGRVWLLGETNGMIIDPSANTNVIRQEAGTTISWRCTERYPVRQFSAAYLAAYIPEAVGGNPAEVGPYSETSWAEYEVMSWYTNQNQSWS